MTRRQSKGQKPPGSCTLPLEFTGGLHAIVNAYLRDFRLRCAEELEWFASRASLSEVIPLAATATRKDGKRLDHQRRIPEKVLRASAKRLQKAEASLRAARTFDELHTTVSKLIGNLHGIGKLTVYDTSLRIGAHLGLEPELVYLHAGTRDGALALGVSRNAMAVSLAELPEVFKRLAPREVEDCLCIYKDALARNARKGFVE